MMLACKGFKPGLVATYGDGEYKYHPGSNTTEKAFCAQTGFHCAENPLECFNWYPWDGKNEFWLVEPKGDIDDDGKKISCTEMYLVARLNEMRFLRFVQAYLLGHPECEESWTHKSSGPIHVYKGKNISASGKLGDYILFINTFMKGMAASTIIHVDGKKYMIFEKAEIGQKLKALKAAVPQSRSAGAESITQGVLFEGNTMAASNGVIYAQAKIPYNIAEPFILPPNGVDLICGLDDPQVSIEKDGDNVKVAGAGKKRAKATLLTGTIDNFMRIAPPQQGMRNVSVDAEELIAAIKRVGYAVSLNPNRPAMTGIYFKAENGKLNLVGCDGSQLAKVEFPYEEDFHFILPNETAKSLAALDLHGQCQITGDHKKAVFSTEDYTLTTSLICGEYMNYESVIPKAGKYDVVFDRDSLLGAATRVKNLMDLKHREPVVLHIDGESCYITSRLTGVEFHEDVLCQGTIPEPMNIAFDDILLLNGISATKGEGIRALLNSSLSPMRIENEGFTALVLPVRMKNRA